MSKGLVYTGEMPVGAVVTYPIRESNNYRNLGYFHMLKRAEYPELGAAYPFDLTKEKYIECGYKTMSQSAYIKNYSKVNFCNGEFFAYANSIVPGMTAPLLTITKDFETLEYVNLPHPVATGYCNGIAYFKGKYCMTFSTGRTFSSTDGRNWVEGTAIAAGEYSIMAQSGNTLVAIKNQTATAGNVFAYTVDGINWTVGTLPASLLWSGITYGNGMFIAVSRTAGTVAAKSTDGITWTSLTIPTGTYNAITYGNGMFVIGTYLTTAAGSLYSTNGTAWTSKTLTTGAIVALVPVDNGFIVKISGTVYLYDTSFNMVATASGAITGSDVLTYGNDMFVSGNGNVVAFVALPNRLPDYVVFGNTGVSTNYMRVK